MEREPLPEVYQAALDEETCAALFRDLMGLDSPLEVSVKQRERGLTEAEAAWSLAQAQKALAAGHVRAVQVRYLHDGVAWIDTIIQARTGYRVVRVQERALSSSVA